MRSLRGQLLLGVTLGTTVVLVVSAVLLHGLITRALWSDFDDALAAKARSLAVLAEQDEEGVDFEPPEAALAEFTTGARPEYYQLWQADGAVLARSPSLDGRNLDRPTGPRDVSEFRSVSLPDGRDGRLVGLTFVPRQEFPNQFDPTTLTLVVGRGVDELQGTLARLRTILFAVSLVALSLSATLLVWAVRRSLRPIGHLTGQIAAVGEADLSARIHAIGMPAELLPVVDRLNDLLARLEAAFQRERRFTGDVAHELRTPLAGGRAKMELALSKDRPAGDYRQTIDDCLRINLQMQSVVEKLLHLARADAGQLEVRRQPVDLPKLVTECWRPLQDRANARLLDVEWRLNGVQNIETDRGLLALVIHNVLDNAVAHVNEKGRVVISSAADNGEVELAVTNTGCALPADRVPQVFDRFWRGDPTFRTTCDPASRTPDDAHCGLGLPLCKAVIECLGGSIKAEASVTGLFTLSIRLPRPV